MPEKPISHMLYVDRRLVASAWLDLRGKKISILFIVGNAARLQELSFSSTHADEIKKIFADAFGQPEPAEPLVVNMSTAIDAEGKLLTSVSN